MIKIRKYKGHIRNWRDLCKQLNVDETLPRGQREEAILIEAYQAWGCDMGLHLHGAFAAALWDEQNQKLFCLRDPFGAKPFYYYVTAENEMLCDTSIREMMKHPGFVKELNQRVLQIYLSLTYVPGDETFFKGVKKLLPGRCMVWHNQKLEIQRYWHPTFQSDHSKSLDDWADELHATLRQIMTEIKDENEYAESFLSGGVDSSYILAMSGVNASNSCGYNSPLDESAMAAETAAALGKTNRRCLITPEAYFTAIPQVVRNMELPLADASSVAFALGCQAAAQHTKICFSGEGADEFFGGYNIYRKAEQFSDDLETFYVGNTNIMKEEEKRQILKNYDEDFLPISLAQEAYSTAEGLDPLAKMTNVDIQLWLEGDILLNVDKMSEAAGIDVRMPFLDLRIFEIAAKIPSKCKLSAEQNKLALRVAAAKVLPDEIASREKIGFAVPIRSWLADERYNQFVRTEFCSATAEKFFHTDKINAILDNFIAGNYENWRKIWAIYVYILWCKEYF